MLQQHELATDVEANRMPFQLPTCAFRRHGIDVVTARLRFRTVGLLSTDPSPRWPGSAQDRYKSIK